MNDFPVLNMSQVVFLGAGGSAGGLKKKKKNLLSVAIIAHPLFPRLQIIRFS